MKFSIKYFLIWFIISIILWFIIWSNNFLNSTNSSNKDIETTVVELWNIKKTIEVVWDSELVDEQSLSFNKIWTVTNIYFSEWDKVKKWDTIAKLDDSDVYRNIEDAKLNLENAKISLKQLYESADDSKIKQAKNNISVLESNYNIGLQELKNLKISQQNSISKLQSDIDTQKKELENTKKEKDNLLNTKVSSKNTTITNIEDSFKNYLLDIDNAIESSDEILWVSTKREKNNDNYENYLWAKNTALKSTSEKQLLNSITLYNNLIKDVDKYSYKWDSDEIKLLLNKYLKLFNSLYETTNNLYKTLDNSVVSVWNLSESDISSMKQTISQRRSSMLSKIDSINNDLNSLNSLTDTDLESSSNQTSIEKMEIALENSIKNFNTTKKEYEITYISKQKDLDDKKENIDIAKTSLEELLEWPTENNVSKSKNSITQAKLKLTSAYEDLENYKLIAPFDWVIRKIDYKSWDNLKDSSDKYIYVENPNLLEVSVMLDQIDIVKVEIWDKAVVTFDAYTNDPVNAKISSIDTTPVKSSWVVSYEVKLVLDDPDFDKKILSWMTSDVEIINESKDNILLLNTSVIKSEDNIKYVILENGEKKVIETWLTGDWKTEITYWLEEWDKVIVWDFNIVSEKSATTLFGDWPWSWKHWWWRPQ